MATSKTIINGNTALYGFYQPHKRVTFNNELVNPVTGEVSHPPSMTKQEFAKQCDINNIIKEFSLTGQINHINAAAAQGAFLDLPDSVDYQEHLHTIMAAEAAFAALPAKMRDRFQGDPATFLAFVQDPKNADELIELGIRERPPRTNPSSPPAPSAPDQAPAREPNPANSPPTSQTP